MEETVSQERITANERQRLKALSMAVDLETARSNAGGTGTADAEELVRDAELYRVFLAGETVEG